MTEPAYDVVWPSSRQVVEGVGTAAGLASWDHATIAFVWDHLFQGDVMFEVLESELAQRFPGATFVPHAAFGNVHGPDAAEQVAALPARLREHGVDAAIVGVGACGACTPAVMRVCAAIERAGVPSVPIVTTAFVPQFRATAHAAGLAELPIAEYPGIVTSDSEETLRARVREAVLPAVLDGLERPSVAVAVAPRDVEPGPRDVVASGSLDEVVEEFEAHRWSDGLPFVPPTVERVEAFLAHSSRGPDEVLGVLGPANRVATVWSVAVNGVMAGARPEHLPVLLAVVEAIAAPEFHVEHAASTGGWEVLVVVSGPAVGALGFDSGPGLMRVGRRANSAVGRFTRLYLRNVAGLLPGETDKGSIGSTFLVAMAEDPEVLRGIGWPTYGEDRGVPAGTSSVTVQSVLAVSAPVYTSGDAPEDHLEILADYLARTVGPWGFTGIFKPHQDSTILLGPSVARLLAEAGWTKDRVRAYLREHARIPASRFVRAAWDSGNIDLDLRRQVELGLAPADYAESDDPERLVPVCADPSWINLVVGGDPGRNQSKVYLGHNQGPAVTRPVDLG